MEKFWEKLNRTFGKILRKIKQNFGRNFEKNFVAPQKFLKNSVSTLYFFQIEEMEDVRDKQADKGELDDLIDALRKEKDHLESKLASLQEQLSKSMCEIVKLKEQLLHSQEECRVSDFFLAGANFFRQKF